MSQLDQSVFPIEMIEVGTCGFRNCRTHLGDLTDIKSSIVNKGLIVPPIVWDTVYKGKPHKVLLCGHRRFAAIQQIRRDAEAAGGEVDLPFVDITCSVFEGTLQEATAISLVDNIQHESLNPADMAEAVTMLVEQLGNQIEAGKVLSKSQPWVSNYVSIFRGLISPALEALRQGQITSTQAKKLAMLLNPDKTPNVAVQTEALERLTRTGGGAEDGDEKVAKPVSNRPKTHRAKSEMEELRKNLALSITEDPTLNVQYRINLGNFLKFFFCEADAESALMNDFPEIVAAEVAPAAETTKKRRIHQMEV